MRNGSRPVPGLLRGALLSLALGLLLCAPRVASAQAAQPASADAHAPVPAPAAEPNEPMLQHSQPQIGQPRHGQSGTGEGEIRANGQDPQPSRPHTPGTHRRFNRFSIELPAGWQGSEEGDVVTLVAPDKSAALTVVSQASEGQDVQLVAETLARELGAESPPRQDGPSWVFSFANQHGAQSRAVLSQQGPRFVVFIFTGESPHFAEMLKTVQDR